MRVYINGKKLATVSVIDFINALYEGNNEMQEAGFFINTIWAFGHNTYIVKANGNEWYIMHVTGNTVEMVTAA